MRCPNEKCNLNGKPNSRYSCSITKGTFFAGTRKSYSEVLEIIYNYLSRHVTQLVVEKGMSSATASDFGKNIRQVMSSHLDSHPIVLEGKVQIDERKFTERDGSWVFGGVKVNEDGSSGQFFAVAVENHNRATWLPLIETYVAPGTTIVSDIWGVFSSINNKGRNYGHLTVNDSRYFVDPEAWAHTNNIEGRWSVLKCHIPQNRRRFDIIQPYLDEEMFRCKFRDNLWKGFIGSIAEFKLEN